ncbi:Uncharacterised protein [Bordetella pertussis]|nr:Uncharacterised protein [Bordetella pertussis]CFW07260.1 Uncharacterised protein [Bordetella pertussis]CFW35833.1 Uncharacterised protein [Bordetella pertussis]
MSTPSSGKRFFSSPTTRGIRPSGLAASMPSGVLRAGSMAGNSDSTGMPSLTHCSATGSSVSSE